jgi:tetratricopeptide (TPR) repeat protein
LLTFIFILLFIFGHVFSLWFKNNAENFLSRLDVDDEFDKIDFFLAVTAWVVLTISMLFAFHGPVLWWLWFVLLGLTTVGLSFVNSEAIKEYEWEIADNPQYNLSFSFVVIVIMAGITMVGVLGARMYIAETVYAKALSSQNYQEAQENLQKALGQRPNSDLYHAALAQVYLMQAVTLAANENPDMQTVSGYVAVAVNEAKQATEISPRSVAIWENLAIMYENAASLVPEAREWAIKSWQQAKDLEPTNPVLSWRLGNNYLLAEKTDEATKNYQEAISLKADYLDAYMSLARVYESQNKVEEAVEVYKNSLNLGSSNATFLFDFGRLLYNRNKDEDRSDAEKLWLASIRIQPNYSNALYSLGLLYENKGDKTTALQYYYKVKDLNAGNTDIEDKIKSLVGVPKTTE